MKQQLKDLKTLLLLGSCLLLAACTGRTSKASGSEEAKPVITVTIEPQRYFTEAIAGDKFTVVSMVPKGSSPETYDPIPQQLVSLGDSKAYLRIGYIGFEQTWMDRLMNNTPHIQVFDTSKGIDLILNNGEHNHAAGHHDHDGHNHAVEPLPPTPSSLPETPSRHFVCSTSPTKHIIWHVTTPSANVSSTPTALSAGNFPLRNRPKPL